MVTHQESINAALYHNDLQKNSLASIERAETEKNIAAGKRLVKIVLVAIAFVGIMHFTSGCTDNSNPVQAIVCSTQSTPSPICPNVGK